MRTAQDAWTIARQIAFFEPTDRRGKWHAAWLVSHAPVCGSAAPLGTTAIRTEQGTDSAAVHKVVCRRCLRLSTAPGVTANGMER